MPYIVNKIDPLDLQPRKAIGVSLPFSANAVFNQTYQSKDAIKTNLINFFLTAKGERYLNPSFGNALQRLLFENIVEGTLREIDAQVREDLAMYFPRVVATNVGISSDPDAHTITFSLTYYVKDTNIDDTIILNFLQ